ncbi:quinol dehydrogenase ferredoxin subunit NapH [Helicobacter sp. 12S02634-8]|uniref:quinol dehydrogenase ferredoxin subunit NapH n=1 Tax=Helicobacter sp. 12S02634-8 TaxID=1476199 RepID=UPI000BA79B18|nr:quinol dehydrogenase ferredoxin subunit NapH [Helicobacter sp. 12S02634-8]PAF46202.1 quinol dehydrogenase ferredoxin subunit NapH [Helicobacter sp. 12S02634-8]
MSYRFLILRRVIQIGILALFFVGNFSWILIANQSFGVYQGDISSFVADHRNLAVGQSKDVPSLAHVLQGNLSNSKLFGVIPMSDPLMVAQLFLAGGALSLNVYIGLLVVLGLYGVFLGRAYCAYVCPINLVTDFASFLRRWLGSYAPNKQIQISRNAKYGVLLLSLVLSFVFGIAAFEMISPIGMFHRGVVFGMGAGFFGILLVFLFDLLWVKNGFCGHLCPLGAMYGLIGKYSIWRVGYDADKCSKCMRCVQICPENQVLHSVGKKSTIIDAMACIKCGRCIEVCADDALTFKITNPIKKEIK